MADSNYKSRGRRQELPLPPPEEDRSSRVRVTSQLPSTTVKELPFVHSDSARFESVEDELNDASTVVEERGTDSLADLLAADDAGTDVIEADDTRVSEPPPTPPPALPLPAPETDEVAGRAEATRAGKGAAAGRVRRAMTASASGYAIPRMEAVDTGTDGPLVGGRYRIVERIGQGGMGKVFKVRHNQLGKTFALKVISDNLAGEGKARDLFYREARLASSLSHPNIASVVDFGEDEQLGAFMVMELLTGVPLSRVLRREGRLSVKYSCDIMLQVAEALHYIHGNNIVHCDIKTENILLCELPGTKRRKQQVKLLDFGLARSTNTGRATASLSGTPHYVAPERIRGEAPSPPNDIYGLGILFYELLTGKVPWDGNVASILCGHLEQEPTPPSELIDGGLDPAVEKLILRALAKTPEQRHKDMAAFIYELRTVMDMLGFGRRKRAGTRHRIIIERSENKRDETVRRVFDASRIPQALLNLQGLIVVANAAFAKFVMGVAVDVEGLSVQATPLANAWRTVENDLTRACSGHPVRRIIEVDVAEGETRRLLMWLDPGVDDGTALFGVHPLAA